MTDAEAKEGNGIFKRLRDLEADVVGLQRDFTSLKEKVMDFSQRNDECHKELKVALGDISGEFRTLERQQTKNTYRLGGIIAGAVLVINVVIQIVAVRVFHTGG